MIREVEAVRGARKISDYVEAGEASAAIFSARTAMRYGCQFFCEYTGDGSERTTVYMVKKRIVN